MSLRIQIFCIIVSLALLTIVIGVGTGTLLIQGGIARVEDDCLTVVADLADAFISSKLDFLKSSAKTIALDVARSTDANIESVLQKHCNTSIGVHDDIVSFPALTVVERTGEGTEEKFIIVASRGTPSVPEKLLLEKPNYMVKAFAGNLILSTTVAISNTADSGQKVVFFVCAPVEQTHEGHVKRILCATLDGLYLSNILDKFRIWDDEGDIVLCDGDGNVIASIFQDITLERTNYIKLAKLHPDPELLSLSDFFSQMIAGKSGSHSHTLRGQQRVGYFRPITGSALGWSLGVTAPVFSSPNREASRGIFVIALVSFAVSCFVAFFASGFLVKPYKAMTLAKEIAEKASESKSTFLANMSHEMRTPLNAVIGFSELAISSGEAQGELATNLEKIYNSSITLLGTINDLLDISKIEAGKFELIPVEYDLPSLINDTAALNNVRVGSKPIQFTLKVAENLPSKAFGDELRVKQVLNNLLSNAIKYTREGSVNWSITCEGEGDSFVLIFKVTDTGIGIRQEDIAILFMEYHQVDSKANRKIEGTGLGLAIVRKMVTLMGGTITVDSEYGKGSTFTLKIPQKRLTNDTIGKDVAFNLSHMRHFQTKLARNSKLIRLKLPYARVLVVDDVQTNLDVARGMLKPYEIQVDCVMSGHQAIEAVRERNIRYNAIFMDHMMPEMDGIEATQRIRALNTEYARTVPIIALTANAIVGNEEMFLKNGFQAFLSKPIDIMRLDLEIRRWLRDKSQETDSLAGQVSSLSAYNSGSVINSDIQSSWEIEGLDKHKALSQFGGSNETLLIILHSYVDNTPGLLDKIRTFTEAQLQDYALLVHGIKGTTYGICADEVGKQAEALEHAARRRDFQYVSAHNDALIDAVEALIDRIRVTLYEIEQS